jgi:protein TonB
MLDAVLNQKLQRRPLGRSAVTSLVAHVCIVGIVLYVSAHGPKTLLEDTRAVTFFNPPPPPPPPPPPAGGSTAKHVSVQKKIIRKPDTFIKPDKPTEKPSEPEPQTAPEPGGVAGGVKGGVEGGVVGGVVGGTLGGTLGGQLGGKLGGSSVLPFGAGMTRPSLVSKRDPVYPREAAVAKVGGLMLVKCVITTEGSLRSCRIVKGLPYMDQPVLSALSSWKYTPIQYQGRAVSVEYVIPVRLVPP